MPHNSMDEANKLLTVCAEFEVVAASHQQRHGHVKLIMTDLFDLVGIQRLYNGGGISEEDAVAMVERNCKYVREELKRSGVFKAKKKQKSVVAPMPQQFDGMKQNGSPIGDIAKLNSLIAGFSKVSTRQRSFQELAELVTSKLTEEELKELIYSFGSGDGFFERTLMKEYAKKHSNGYRDQGHDPDLMEDLRVGPDGPPSVRDRDPWSQGRPTVSDDNGSPTVRETD